MAERKCLIGWTACVGAVLAMASWTTAAVVNVPPTGYTENFNDNVANDFVKGGFADYGSAGAVASATATGGVYVLDARARSSGYGGSTVSAAIQANLGAANTGFVLSSTATPTLINQRNTSSLAAMSLGALGSGLNIDTSNNTQDLFYSSVGSYYRAEFVILKGSANGDGARPLGALKIYSVLTNTSTAVASGLFNATPSVGATYNMTLEGTYVGGALTLSFTVDDPSTPAVLPVTITTASIASPFAGNSFGYALSSGNSENVVNFDNFAITIPEPVSLSLAGLAPLGLLARRRKVS